MSDRWLGYFAIAILVGGVLWALDVVGVIQLG